MFIMRFTAVFIFVLSSTQYLQAFVTLKSGSEFQMTDLKIRGLLRGALIENEIEMSIKSNSQLFSTQKLELNTPPGLLISEFAFRIEDDWVQTQRGDVTAKKHKKSREKPLATSPVSLAHFAGRGYILNISGIESNKKIWLKFKTVHELGLQAQGFESYWPTKNMSKLETFDLKLDFYVDFAEQINLNPLTKKIGELDQLDREGKHFAFKVFKEKISFSDDIHIKLNRQQVSTAKKSVATTHRVLEKNEAWVDSNPEDKKQSIFGLHWLKGLPPGTRKLPKELLVFVDTSRGARERLTSENAQFFTNFLKSAPKSLRVQSFAFDSSVRPLGEIQAQLSNLDGGSSYSAILHKIEAIQAKKKEPVDVLIFSDAFFSLQSETQILNESWKAGALFVLPQTRNYNSKLANALARQNGGFVLSLNGKEITKESTKDSKKEIIETIWQQMKARLWRLQAIGLRSSLTAGAKSAQSYPKVGSTFRADEPLHIYIDLTPFAEDSSGIAKFSDGMNELELNFNMTIKNDAASTTEFFNINALRNNFGSKGTSPTNVFELDQQSHFLNDGQCFALGAQCPSQGVFFKNEELPLEDIAASLTEEDHPPMTLALPEPTKKALRKEWIESGVQVATDAKDVQAKYIKSTWTESELLKNYLNENSEFVEDPWFFAEYAEAFQQKGDRLLAQKVISNLFEYGKLDSQYLRSLGLLGCLYNFCDESIEAFERLIQREPAAFQNYRDLAWLYFERGDSALAVKTLKRMKTAKLISKSDSFIEKELLAMENFVTEEKSGSLSKHWPAYYSWISWDNLEIDVDFWIKETPESLVSFNRTKGIGQLLNDSTRGDRPEIYLFDDKKLIFPDYFASYHASDKENEKRGGLVRWTQVFRSGDSKLIFKSAIVPMYQPGKKVKLNSPNL